MKFSTKLLRWYYNNKRELPWRENKDPYKIWLSEIILQQTRVNQGIEYYKKFICKFSNIKLLAEENEDNILKMWEGLGYYSRARNIHKTAKIICKKNQGVFPSNYKNIIKLPGIGPYTAAAILSICFNKKYAVVDGNVLRVLARYFGMSYSINSVKGIKHFKLKAHQVLPKKNYGDYNQAIMEFGALNCTPRSPKCEKCILKSNCKAFLEKKINILPRKIKKSKIKNRFLEYFIIKKKDFYLINKRTNNDIWKHLYEFPSVEYKKKTNSNEVEKSLEFKLLQKKLNINSISKITDSICKLSHQKIYCRFWQANCYNKTKKNTSPYTWLRKKNIQKLAFPMLIKKELNNLLQF